MSTSPVDHYPEGARPSEDDLLSTLADVVHGLDAAEVDHALMGGISAYTMARPRVTDDIDLFVRPGDVRRVLDALGSRGFETAEHDPSWLAKAWKRGVLVDIIFRSSGDIYLDDEMMARRRVETYKGVRVGMVAPEDLLVIKALAAAEPTPHHWYDALALIARCDLDWPYVLQRARQAGPRRVLSLLLYAESSDLVVPSTTISALYEAVHPAGRGDMTQHDQPVPAYLAAHVHDALAQDPACAELGIDVTVTGERLFLNGTVTSEDQRQRASAVAASLAPDLVICNDIEVLGTIEGHGEPEHLS